MITLTTPPQINSVLGGNTPINYDRFVLSPITFDPRNATVSAAIRITSTSQADMQAIAGSLSINLATGILQVEVPQLDFYRRVTLTGPQITSVQNIMNTAQNSLESGLITLGVIAGSQSAGV